MSNENEEIKLTDLLEVELLQKIQDAFSKATGMAALTTDLNGKPVTQGSNFTRYCMDYTRCSEVGKCMCEECDRFGAEETLRTGHSTTYVCHSGLVDFSAPIMAGGELIGCFIGGQVLYEKPEEKTIKEIANNLSINEDEYWDAIQEIPIIDKSRIDSAAEFLYTVAGVISEIAYSRYLTIQANESLANSAKMQGDFLANMSHEIRTPMNAVIGFAEMALREELPDSARTYIEQIKNSGNALLTIINDILDYSKIESGKMDIIPAEYEPLSMIDDVANIIMTRIVDKDVELLLDVDSNIPSILFGDNLRIRQILINICNNATKFTNHGYVKLVVSYEWADYSNILLHFSVEDTGIGIKPDDLDKIFNSFQQVDSKRNRNIEGTGLGLTICRRLLTLMDSDLEVQSEYEKGSVFSFTLKQKVVDSAPSIMVENPEKIALAGAFFNKDVADDFLNDATKLGVIPDIFMGDVNRNEKIKEWASGVSEDIERFFVVEQSMFDPEVFDKIGDDLKIHSVVLADTFADLRSWSKYKNLLILRKPVSVMNLSNLLNNKGVTNRDLSQGSELYSFTAPEAKVLVVDDNIVNLSVAKGLMEPLKMEVDIASSGKEAIRMSAIKPYDLIFMDHMMPEMDGIETTEKLRHDYPDYKKVPIIALSANAVSGAKDMFRDAGMNDFVAKPIEIRSLVDAVRRYLPKDKIIRGNSYAEDDLDEAVEEEVLVIADLDTSSAIKLLGSKNLYMNVLKIYYDSIDSKAERIRKLYENKDWNEYSIEVHALKSSSRQIGAMELGELAFTLEMAGKNEDVYLIERDTDKLLADLLEYKLKLKDYVEASEEENTDQEDKPLATKEELKKIFGKLRVAISDFDFEEIEKIAQQLDKFSYSPFYENKYKSLVEAIEVMDLDECILILDNWH